MNNKRILIVDDDSGIRETYQEILSPTKKADLLAKGASLFDESEKKTKSSPLERYHLTITEKGLDGIAAVKTAVQNQAPFSAAFVDMKMPGIDGAETSKRIWAVDSNIKIVIVTAYSEYTPDDIIRVTGRDDIFYLRKPFNPDEIKQFARAFTNQWCLEREKEDLSEALESANKELSDLNLNLQKKVDEQTTLIVQSEKMATIGILAAGVAHEINNPMSFINGNLSAIKKYSTKIYNLMTQYTLLEESIENGLTSHLADMVSDIRSLKKDQKIDFILDDMSDLADESLEGAARVSDIVKDLKTFSRIDEADYKLADINQTIDSTLNLIRNELKYKAEVIKAYGQLPEIKCFPKKLSQVFMNIIINAAQAIEKKGTIKIETQYQKIGRREDDANITITISDTGKGIPADNLSKIFDPFFTSKPVGEGTGLGLAITYDIVKAHSGKINVESTQGKGTTFIITLPMKKEI